MNNSALVVIDLQNDITKNYKEIIGTTNQAIDWAVANNMDVVYIQHNNLSAGTRTFKPNTHGAEFVPELKIVSDYIFTKAKSNALTSEEFVAFIQKHNITEFFITGADATAHGTAAERRCTGAGDNTPGCHPDTGSSNGTGRCLRCKGSGIVFNPYSGENDRCPACSGEGRCRVCFGTGRVD